VRDPVHAAADAATLDVLAPGRVLLGVGAGHTFAEWEVTGRSRPAPADRAGRLVEFVDAVARLLNGETVTIDGRYLQLTQARLDDLPTAGRVRLMVGGGHPDILRVAAARASVVALAGLGRTLPDGHRHQVRWNRSHLDAMINVVRAESEKQGTTPEIEALVQVVTVTDDRAEALAGLADQLPAASPEDLGQTPFLLVGSIEQMAEQLTRQAEQLGITRYVVREAAVDAAEQILALLDDRSPAKTQR
jgi:alkanesulfonate monooxygenase SsuD/methylene tetrahydromethanopterin reductase-like flavin-dependent oxidoreductase (luciferase family)